MKSSKMIFIIIILFSFISFAEEMVKIANLEGKLMNNKFQPVIGKVYCDGKLVGSTDKAGRFLITNLEPGMHEIFVDAGKYSRKKLSVIVREGWNDLNIVLPNAVGVEKFIATNNQKFKTEKKLKFEKYAPTVNRFSTGGWYPFDDSVYFPRKLNITVFHELEDLPDFTNKIGSWNYKLNFAISQEFEIFGVLKHWLKDEIDNKNLKYYGVKMKLYKNLFASGWIKNDGNVETRYGILSYKFLTKNDFSFYATVKGRRSYKAQTGVAVKWQLKNLNTDYGMVRAIITFEIGKDWYGKNEKAYGINLLIPEKKLSVGILGKTNEDNDSAVLFGISYTYH